MSNRLLRIKEVTYLTGLARSTIYEFIDSGKFPRQTRISNTIAAWSEAEVLDWIQAQLDARDALLW